MKIFAVDFDDVCFALVSLWTKKYNFLYDDNLDVSSITDWDISKFVNPKCGNKIYDMLDTNMYKEKNIIVGSLWGVNELRNAGYRVIFATSNSFNMGGAKFDWLNRNGFEVRKEDYFEVGDKSLINCDYLLDDNHSTILGMDGRGILFTQPWNMKYGYTPRVDNWFELIRYMKEAKENE